MKKSIENLRLKDTIKAAILYIAFELRNSKWKLAFNDGSRIRYTVDYRTVLPTLYSTILPINPVACSVPSAPL